MTISGDSMRLNNLKKGNSKKEKTSLMLFLLFCVLTLSLSVGYSALNEELNISGEAAFRVKEEIRITSVSLSETTNLGLENYSSKYGKDSITLGVSLPNIESSVTYKVEIVNSGSVTMWIDSITEEIKNNTNMEYVLDGIGVKQLINPGETKEFNLTIKYKDGITLPENKNLDTMLRFNFVKPTSTLARGNTGAATTTFFNSGPITKESVEEITFLPTIEVGDDAIGYWDASENKDKTVIAWYTDKDNNSLYELYIGGIGEVNLPVNSANQFRYFNKLKTIDFSGVINTSNVTSMASMFTYCSELVGLDLSDFDTSKVTNIAAMFAGCSKLISLDLSNFDTSNVTRMEEMLRNCSSLANLNISLFNTSNVTNMSRMFSNCSKLASLDLSNFDTSKVTDMHEMFSLCTSIKNLNISSFDTSNVTNMASMFGSTTMTNNGIRVENLEFGEHFNTSRVTNMSYMFAGCINLTNLDVSKFDTSNVTDMHRMFQGCASLTELDLSNFNTSNVTNMYGMFYNWYDNVTMKLKRVNLSSFDTSNVTNMRDMFFGCRNLEELNLDNFNTEKVTNMSGMFYNCKSLTKLDLSSFKTPLLTSISDETGSYNKPIFSGCTKLESLDISGFDFTNVTFYDNAFLNVPDSIIIKVKDDETKNFIIENIRSDLNNVTVVNL